MFARAGCRDLVGKETADADAEENRPMASGKAGMPVERFVELPILQLF
ncbi:MAG: hypothetical protein ACK5LS_05175 [Propioniciclava sp.]